MNQERSKSLDARLDLMREIHEQVIQRLFGVSLALASDGEFSVEDRTRCSEELRTVLTELRAALGRPLAPRERKVSRRLKELLDSLEEIDRVEINWEDGLQTPSHLEMFAQSIVLEAVRNAERHSRDGSIEVRVSTEEQSFLVEIENDQVDPSIRGGGIGLRLLSLEALQHDALVESGPRGDDRWRVRLQAPLES